MGRPSNKAQRRAEIVEALQKVIASVGYEKASIQLIAKEAGLASGLVHYHFHNKQEILVELIQSLSEISIARYTQFKAEATNAEQRIEAFINAALAIDSSANQQAVAAWVSIGAEAIRQEEVQALYQQSIARQLKELQTLLHDFLTEHQLTPNQEKIEHLAAMIVSAIEGSYQLATGAEQVIPTNHAAKTLITMTFSSLAQLSQT